MYPHLIQHLLAEFNRELHEAGRKDGNFEPAQAFAEWAAQYLTENPVAESFFLDANYGVKLTNGVTVSICPEADVKGTMQESGAVPVMTGTDRRGQTPGGTTYGEIRIK